MITVPDSCLPLLRKHRTHYTNHATEYGEELADTFSGIEPYLPDSIESVLDVGCGLAGIDVLFGHCYPDAVIHLADRQGQSGRQVGGFHSDPKTFGHYHDFALALELLEANGVENKVKCHELIGRLPSGRFDVVISLLSWGFHYPISTYKPKANLIIADIRKGTDGIDQLSKYGKTTIIHDAEKYERVAVQCGR